MECHEEQQGNCSKNSDSALASASRIGAEESARKMNPPVPVQGPIPSYPERTDEPDCPYYMRTGVCAFGMGCRFNHPPAAKQAALSRGEFPERIGQPECKYYLKTGTCKFGATCKYHHPREKIGLEGHLQLNYLGLPIRQGEKDCAYYMRTGCCKYGANCKFHHPQPAALGTVMPISGYVSAGSSSTPSSVAPYLPGLLPYPYVPSVIAQGSPAYVPVILSASPDMLSTWTSYQGPMSPLLSPEMQQRPLGKGPGHSSTKKNDSAVSGMQGVLTAYVGMGSAAMQFSNIHSQPTATHREAFPERPGQPECQYYMKTGNCKFGGSCRYHHPKAAAPCTCKLSPIGLPLRPDQPACAFYSRYGVCKFGPTCKFDHPLAGLSYSPSASSLSELPVVPYPRSGSPTTTLVRSNSSENSQTASKTKDQLSGSEPTSLKQVSNSEDPNDISEAAALDSSAMAQSAESYSA